jgi:alpha-tubulin suppressor-like RCC1 family protein
MNVAHIISALHEKVDSATTIEESIIIAKSIEKLNLRTVKVSATFFAMVNEDALDGELYFCEEDNTLYFRRNIGDYKLWIPVMNTLSAVYSLAWGDGTDGRLGDGTVVDKSSPVSVVGGYTDWIQVSAGDTHSLGVRANGTAWAWGSGANGRLGDGTIVSRSSPVSVIGGFTDWIQVSGGTGAGSSHSLGIRSNGTAYAWGAGGSGRLGDGTTVGKSSLVSVVGGFTDWIQVSGGAAHSLGLRANGTAWAWGAGLNGRLGDGTADNKSSPVSVVGGFTDWIQVSGGSSNNIGLRANGTAWTWGFNGSGELGDDTVVQRSSPVSVIGGFTDWIQVSGGDLFSLGLRANGTAWAWGNNGSGRLGNGTVVSTRSPVSVIGGYTDWIQVDAGASQSLGLRANGTAWAWGNNGSGRLGDGTVVDKSSPVSVVGGFTNWIQVAAGSTHSLALRATII